MKYSQEISKLVIENLAQHEHAQLVLNEVDEILQKAIAEEVKRWIKSQSHQLYDMEKLEINANEDMNISLLNWQFNAINKNVIKFVLTEYYGALDKTASWLGLYTGLPDRNSGLMLTFYAEYGILNLKSKQYKNILREYWETSSHIKQFFKLSDDGYNLEYVFRLNLDEVAEHYPNSLSNALSPLTEALESFDSCRPEFDELVSKLKNASLINQS